MQAGFGIAVEYALSVGLDQIWERVQELAAYLRQRLRQVPGVTVIDKGRRLCGIVSFVQVCACQLLAGVPVLGVPLLSCLRHRSCQPAVHMQPVNSLHSLDGICRLGQPNGC